MENIDPTPISPSEREWARKIYFAAGCRQHIALCKHPELKNRVYHDDHRYIFNYIPEDLNVGSVTVGDVRVTRTPSSMQEDIEYVDWSEEDLVGYIESLEQETSN